MIGRKDNNVINTAYRFRLFLDEHQEQLIGQNLGACRWLYNRMLSDRTETYRQSGISEKRTPAWYKHLHPYCDWLKKADSLALANVQLNLEKAFDSFFSGRSGYPKFKRKSAHYDSYTTNMVNNNIVLKRRHGKAYLHLPKISGFMKMKGGRLVRVSKWYPSSQICHECGTVFRKTKDLSIREWTCPHCGHLIAMSMRRST